MIILSETNVVEKRRHRASLFDKIVTARAFNVRNNINGRVNTAEWNKWWLKNEIKTHDNNFK